ncbi:hypothetical protein C9374_002837 [Naegleria lovaniensis]|uniref:Non-haem dioxygenase N-terminal domain-containing protein n=1 Tax=Naegleria lovaniensis TaxID=51637 RepID=A0AA88GV40_NAELO|nr:uncharacterized protein C9374_002837 [Naegleria lovaniensis]KAG2386391.1 hypothetical protein C9374_002837 [Naegleria lovaniensis]
MSANSSSETIEIAKVVNLDYNDLVNDVDLTDKIAEAYGPEGLGLLTVSNVPNVLEYRQAILPLAYKFANLPEEVKNKYVHEQSNFSFGWSHGKEKFNGKTDVFKGSYYANPEVDVPVEDKETQEKYPFYCTPNIWPREDLPEMETAFKNMGQLVVAVGLLVAKQCDRYVQKHCPTCAPNMLYNTISESKNTKSRLLYYYPRSDEDAKEEEVESDDGWCGLHLDHGSLTGLTAAMYFRDGKIVENDDPKAGLYIKGRRGNYIKAGYKPDQLAYQIGESAQIQSGGLLQATPHLVRGPRTPGIGRATLANFMQPKHSDKMDIPPGKTAKDCNVKHFEEGMTFHEFSEKKFSEYY